MDLWLVARRLFMPGRQLCLLILALCLMILSALNRPVPVSGQSAVSLLRFTAIGRVNNILIEWETATEYNNAGFFVWASDSANGTYNPISDFIAAQGDGVTGAVYGFVDSDVEAAVPKYYKLEAIELNQESEFFGPVSAASYIGLPTFTATVTATSTATVTQAAEPQSPTQTATSTLAASNPTATLAATTGASLNGSAYPPQETPYPGQRNGSQASQPAVNYLGTPYPADSTSNPLSTSPVQETTPTTGQMPPGEAEATALETASPNPAETGTPQAIAQGTGSAGLRLPSFTALLVVLLIWGILAGWFYISVRHLE